MREGGTWAVSAAVAVVIAVASLALTLEFRAGRQQLRDARAHLERGIHLYQQGAFAAAQTELRETVRTDPDAWRAPFYLGVIQVHLKRYELAIPFLERAFNSNPTEPKIPNALGVAYFKLGRLDMAKGYFAASLEIDPANADTKALFATMAKLQRRDELAAVSTRAD
jgi:tetratricopeptide (TPR) repeat protein